MAHFRLPPGACSKASSPTVEELWFVSAGAGELWRSTRGRGGEVVPLRPGVAVSIPVGTSFQFRAAAASEVAVVGVTMPPWPGDDEAVAGPGRAGRLRRADVDRRRG